MRKRALDHRRAAATVSSGATEDSLSGCWPEGTTGSQREAGCEAAADRRGWPTKVLRSRSVRRVKAREHLYVIESPTFTGTWVYTKGTFRRKGGREVFYVFVSAKLAV